MKGPQGLGDSGAEASNGACEVFGPRVSELLLSAFADRPPYRRALGAASRVSSDVAAAAFGCAAPVRESMAAGIRPKPRIADECTTAAVPDGHFRCNYSHVVDGCQYLFSAGAEILRMAARRHVGKLLAVSP